MIIESLKIQNFRNCSGLEITFHPDNNFLVGENNLGKSNVLELLRKLFNNTSFTEDDFHDLEAPIQIELKLRLLDFELGHFEDNFDPSDPNVINITGSQDDPNSFLVFKHYETDTIINPRLLRKINFIHYSSLRNPLQELNLWSDKQYGAGRFLRFLINSYVKDNKLSNDNLLIPDAFNNVLKHINNTLGQIKSFSDFNITASMDEGAEILIRKIVSLRDEKGVILSKSGYGVQFLLLLSISLLEKIEEIVNRTSNKCIYEINGKIVLPLVIALDEPEIHLHPFLQRSMIKEFSKILKNESTDFNALLKKLFNIDEIHGQLLVISHSPSILLDDYRQIIRFYKKDGYPKVLSGSTITINPQLSKHFLLQFHFIKEAFFSRGAIVVEGDSEYGSFPEFGKTLSYDFDDLSISVIQARGDAISTVIKLLETFLIPAFGVRDEDGKGLQTNGNLYVTTKRDFEEELICMHIEKNESLLRDIFTTYDNKGENRIMMEEALNKHAIDKYKLNTTRYSTSLKFSEIKDTNNKDLKAFYLTWFSVCKSLPLGRLIGQRLNVNDIPTVYKFVIEALKNAIN